ncbi:glycosyl transferase [Minwuia thermotolerans]|uniref:Glycosyl transferase n=2 Tax=Minwuia thermotolerans TaxID=2056226 RepID=A0A2M9G5S6_9PROT|nr:glycosyl transferase [Minwuia thermotolerans]
MTDRVMIHVQHLLGVGHLKRMAMLAGALAEHGAAVTLVSGGPPAPQIALPSDVEFRQLPPVRAKDLRFSGLIDGEGRDVDDEFLGRRRDKLLAIFEERRPDILVIELFPLGRRQLRFELLALLDQAQGRCRTIACSVRDIVNRRPARESEALAWLQQYFNLLLVHGDARLTPIVDSVPGIGAFRGRIVHTGYLAEPMPGPAGEGEILVSAGGGASGERLFEAAVGASALLRGKVPYRWRFRHGAGTPSARLKEWRAAAASGSVFESVAPDFRARLRGAVLSVSQLGYNTAVDLMQCGTRAVVVPFEGESETEQLRRAAALAPFGLRVVHESGLAAPALAAAVRTALSAPAPVFAGAVDLDGLTCAAETLLARQ